MSRDRWSLSQMGVLVFGVVLVIALAAVGASATAATHRRSATARSTAAPCFTPAQATEDLTGSDLAFVKRLVPCEARLLRSANHRTLRVSASLSREVAKILRAERRVPVARFNATFDHQLGPWTYPFCGGSGQTIHFDLVSRFADSEPPPPLTPDSVAKFFRATRRQAAYRKADAVFGFAYERHALTKGERTPNPVAFGFVGVACL